MEQEEEPKRCWYCNGILVEGKCVNDKCITTVKFREADEE